MVRFFKGKKYICSYSYVNMEKGGKMHTKCYQEVPHGFKAMGENLTFLLVHGTVIKITDSGVRLGSNLNPTTPHMCHWASS